jgi:putative ABC transport system permease protein
VSAHTDPPRLLTAVLARVLPRDERHAVLGDLAELYLLRAEKAGRTSANAWYARQCAGFLLRSWELRRGAGRLHASQQDRRSSVLERVAGEVSEALRPLRRRPGYAGAVVLTLGAGVAGVCAVYTLATWVLLRPVPGVADAEALATVLLHGNERETDGWSMSHADHVALRERATPLAELAASSRQDVHVSGLADVPLRLRARLVTSNYFDVLLVTPLAGRLFDDSAGEAEANAVVLGDVVARRHFGTATAALGAELPINGSTYTVIGVASRGFRGHELPGHDELWLPAAAAPALLHAPRTLTSPDRQLWSTTIARLNDGVSTAALSAELTRTLHVLQQAGVAPFLGVAELRLQAYAGVGLAPPARLSVRRTLRMLGLGAALLLLLACANVANLGLIRATASRGELAMRRALGAGSGRIVRARLIEGGALGLCGAVLGTMLSVIVLRVLSFGAIAGVADSLAGVRVDTRVAVFVTVVAVLAGCLAAVLPALAARRVDARGLLRAADRSQGHGRHTREMLVSAQVALSAVLAVSAGLLGRTLLNLRAVDIGLDTTNAVSFTVAAGMQGYRGEELNALLARIVDAFEREPGVVAVGVVATPPFAGFRIPVVLQPAGDPDGLVLTRSMQVSPGALDALGMTLIAGEPLTGAWLDSATSRSVIINERAVRDVFPDVAPAEVVGRTITMARGEPRPARIAGVVRDARVDHVRDEIEPLYVRLWAHGFRDMGSFAVYIRTRGDAGALHTRIPLVMRAIDPALPPHDIATLDERVSRLTQEPRFIALLGGILTLAALFLTILGLYTVLSQTVLERTREFGVRAALGAPPAALLRAVAARGVALTLVGLGIGLAAASGATRILEARLVGIERLDPLTFVAGALALILAALPATLLPARHAARTDPAVTLRES